jgi:hypothetical protein
MTTPNREPLATEPRGRPFQFTLRTMFIVTTVVAIVCAGLSWPTPWVQLLTTLYLAITVPMAITVAMIYGRGYVRTFSIGAMFPAGLALWYAFVLTMDRGFPYRGYNAPDMQWMLMLGTSAATGLIILGGLIAMGVRWMVESPQRPQPPQISCDPWQVSPDSAASDLTLKSEDDAA